MPRGNAENLVFFAGDDEDAEVPVGGRGEEDDEDDEANEDLSLKILEKSLSRRAVERCRAELGFDDSNETSMADLCASSSGVVSSGLVNGEKCMDDGVKSNTDRREIESAREISVATKDEDGAEIVEEITKYEEAEVDKSMEPNAGETSNNMVLIKLIRGPRYFDAPDDGWESCFNCGEQGHMTINCPTLTRRKKPCFLCGSLEHGVKQCTKAQDCYICKQGGHRARDCPDKYKSVSKITTICLRCGEFGHDMFLCNYEYSQDDLKDIQCYVCKTYGHLCCVDLANSPQWTVSCYRCGQLGHTGLACGRLKDESMGRDSPSSCFRCGERGHFARECPNSSNINFPQGKDSANSCYRCGGVGHFARECPNSTPVFKRHRDTSTPSRKPRKKTTGNKEHHSAPHEPNGMTKRKKTRDQGERGLTTPRKAKHRGGWTKEDPEEDTSRRKSRSRKPRSPSTPSGKSHRISSFNSGGWPASSPSSRRPSSSHHRYSASRFRDCHHCDEYRINNDQW